MPYATQADMTRLGLPAKALEGLPKTTIEAALTSASALADSYLGTRFTLPLTVWADDLRMRVCELASWNAMVTRGFNPESSSDVAVRTRYEDAIRWLEQVAAGRVIPVVTDSASPPSSQGRPRTSSADRRGW